MKCSTCNKVVESYANKRQCRDCYNKYMAEYMLARYHRRRNEFLDEKGGCCVNCGSTKELEIDHIDPDKKSFNLGKALAGWAESRIQQELLKCQVLCKECHSDKSRHDLANRFGRRSHWEHGTLAGRRYCDCLECKKAQSEYMRQWRTNKNKPVSPSLVEGN